MTAEHNPGSTTRTTDPPPPGSGPGDRSAGSEAYRSEAIRYDRRTEQFQHWRELLVENLPANSGDTVLDVGCGTGLCLPLLHDKVGAAGAIIGIDASEQMLEVAAERVIEHAWDNVVLIASPVATAEIDALADAAIFCAVHDLMQSPAALANVVAHLRPGAAVAAIGGKWPLHGCGHCGNGWPTCTHLSSRISPALTSPGNCWPSGCPTCRFGNWPAAAVIWLSGTPRTPEGRARPQPRHASTLVVIRLQ